jgi:hypothetical protein
MTSYTNSPSAVSDTMSEEKKAKPWFTVTIGTKRCEFPRGMDYVITFTPSLSIDRWRWSAYGQMWLRSFAWELCETKEEQKDFEVAHRELPKRDWIMTAGKWDLNHNTSLIRCLLTLGWDAVFLPKAVRMDELDIEVSADDGIASYHFLRLDGASYAMSKIEAERKHELDRFPTNYVGRLSTIYNDRGQVQWSCWEPYNDVDEKEFKQLAVYRDEKKKKIDIVAAAKEEDHYERPPAENPRRNRSKAPKHFGS